MMNEKYELIQLLKGKIEDAEKCRDRYNFFNPEHQTQYRYWDGQVDALQDVLLFVQNQR